ncbi:riboflavin biosynthesis protein RibD [Novosphingobium marinum]|uniref:Riboflavin biosynthesis protein RibD n=1 Tax=Novosphingobium marinum TaxID=1514948 RepID=A0A7Z0BW28_9SPHN|nr:bifunctional diaminohydroxyphosphoribosylaminopyrimidine deaminase/5-amino-6-(5-phosphoribosylamino)uracil reductase RibD [Novosphingobium marinum]NYH96903.1 diaminohydroxyphosphoribosylaminopyrimidine deaminase/5-amino-6-(5-phosphoribosylamino)uracil reductase [Novosphingobium marinum]GGC42502.1 riboflavin biosynthesis protein RibD [Novosphingobium marinum]
MNEDARWLDAAAGLAGRARPLSRPNPAVGAIVVANGTVVGRGWTQPGGRPHAEAVALEMAGNAARGATLYVTLEPCAHRSERGPACADLIVGSGLARVVAGSQDPDPRTAGAGFARIESAGIDVTVMDSALCKKSLAGYLMQRRKGRPEVTLKLATSLDGCIALTSGESRWITGAPARAHAHALRAKSDAILVGGETLRQDDPRLDVRLPGLGDRSPARFVLTGKSPPDGFVGLSSPGGIRDLPDIQYLLVEGGAGTAASFLQDDLVDTIILYRAPVVIGEGRPCIADLGLDNLAAAHGKWRLRRSQALGSDLLEVYSRTPCSQA